MRRTMLAALVVLMAGVAAFAFSGSAGEKLPKCSGHLCRSVNCSPDVLCASGTTVKTCAEVCHSY